MSLLYVHDANVVVGKHMIIKSSPSDSIRAIIMNTRIGLLSLLSVTAIVILLSSCNTLIHSASKGDTNGLIRCINDGADINNPDRQGLNALHWASYHGHLVAVRELIDRGADINFRTTKDCSPISEGSTALIIAAMYCQYDVVKFLVERNAREDIHNSYDESAYAIASKKKFYHIMKILKHRPVRRGV